jgi:tetratricopeptide (TPR) repeat protein
MRIVLKALLYAGLLAACYGCGFSAYRDYSLLMSDDGDDLARRSRAKAAAGTNAPPVTGGTNAPAPPATTTNAPAATRTAARELAALRQGRRVGGNYIRILFSTLGFGVSLTVLGFVAAQDFGRLLKFRLGREVTYVDAKSERNDQFDRAQMLAAKGKHAAALKLLQEILARHPQHARSLLLAAEIHDKEMGDYAAAALHYEQLLRLNLPPEQWGWTAIRLANIYSGKLGQPDTALDLMKRLATTYPDTPAGAKAIKRLAKISVAGLGAGEEF